MKITKKSGADDRRNAHGGYAGINYGHEYGASTAFLAGTQLAGAVVALGCSVSSRFGTYSYDLFAGTPIYKPATFDTARVTFGFQMTAQF